jgi:hypothetical protein
MPFSFKFVLTMMACVSLAACGHDPQPMTVAVVKPSYVLQSQRGAERVTTAGFVSRYQRQEIVPGAKIEPSSPYAQNFSDVMDHLETLMAPQVEENNRIAAMQAADPSFRF